MDDRTEVDVGVGVDGCLDRLGGLGNFGQCQVWSA
jgi:hypothetical protein